MGAKTPTRAPEEAGFGDHGTRNERAEAARRTSSSEEKNRGWGKELWEGGADIGM